MKQWLPLALLFASSITGCPVWLMVTLMGMAFVVSCALLAEAHHAAQVPESGTACGPRVSPKRILESGLSRSDLSTSAPQPTTHHPASQ